MRVFMVPLLAVAFVAAACSGPAPVASSDMGDMPGMAAAPVPSSVREATPGGSGLSGSVDGYTLLLAPDALSFRVVGPGGRVVTRYQPYESELMQFDVVRSDLSGYRHVDAAMKEDGTWVVSLPAFPPGEYRAYATFAAPDASAGTPRVYQLSRAFVVAGSVVGVALPSVSSAATVGGYRVVLGGSAKAGVSTILHLSFSRGGVPVRYFSRYLDGYAHVTAFHQGDLAFGHFTPAVGAGGQLSTQALFSESGDWRVFVRFQAVGDPLIAEFTVFVG